MDGLQKQIVSLNGKVEQLHGVVQHLSQQISTLAYDKRSFGQPAREPIAELESMLIADPVENNIYASLMAHKDILVDGRNRRYVQEGETVLSPDVLIRRLTAQLTAAYIRGAALEEQLLSHRIRS
jgi:hypothetical protein